MIPIAVVVPVRDHWAAFTDPFLRHVLGDEDTATVVVIDNGSVDETAEALASIDDPRLVVLDHEARNISAMWNRGVGAVLDRHPDCLVDIAVVNNDVSMLPGTLRALSDALRASPATWVVSPDCKRPIAKGFGKIRARRVHGSYRHGGILGWCFMLRGELCRGGELCPPFDDHYEWWYSDDAFALTVDILGGHCVVVDGIPIDHATSGTARHHPELLATIAADHARFAAEWGADA